MGKPKPYDHIAEDYRKIEKTFDKLLSKWIALLNLESWKCKVYYFASVNDHDPDFGALIRSLWEYKSFDIRFYLPKIRADYRPAQWEELVVHELCHILVSAMSVNEATSTKFEERTVVELTEILLKLHKTKQ